MVNIGCWFEDNGNVACVVIGKPNQQSFIFMTKGPKDKLLLYFV